MSPDSDKPGIWGTDVCLVLMPYAAVERPSIALSILKAVLTRAGIRSTIVYGNLLFAQEIGVYTHDIIGKTWSHSLAGEWTFSGAAFPEFEPDHEAYFEHIGPGVKHLLAGVRSHGGRGQMKDLFWKVRRRAAGFIDNLAQQVLAARPRIVGVSSTFQQHCASLALLRRIKELDPLTVTLMGGANCEATMGIVTHKECPWVDHVISGEAEDAFLALCERILGKAGAPSAGPARGRRNLLAANADPPDSVIGPECRSDGGRRYMSLRGRPPRAQLEDMNRSPAPDYDDYFEVLRTSPLRFFVNPGLLVETSRGCWWGEIKHCTFCGLNGTSMAYRAKSPDRVVEEIITLAARYKAQGFEVVDNILDMAYFKTVLPALAERASGFNIFYETKANLSRVQLQMLAAAGVRWLQPGIESLDDGILRAIAKGTTARQNLQLMKWAQEYGIYVFWVMLYDVPGETDEPYIKMAEWLPLISHLQPPSGRSAIQYHRFSPYHTRPGDFGLHLSPDRSYGFVYPWTLESIEDFAYFFVDYTAPRDDVGSGAPLERAGLRRFHKIVTQWQYSWGGRMRVVGPPGGEPAQLEMRSRGEGIEIIDTRACRVAPSFLLQGLSAEIYHACDRARDADGLLKELSAGGGQRKWEEVVPVVRDLCEKKLLLDLDGWYFSLAVRESAAKLSNIANHPGGRLRTAAEARAAELLMSAETYVSGQATFTP